MTFSVDTIYLTKYILPLIFQRKGNEREVIEAGKSFPPEKKDHGRNTNFKNPPSFAQRIQNYKMTRTIYEYHLPIDQNI